MTHWPITREPRDLMGEPALRVIAHELVQDLRRNITVDWAHREFARADIQAGEAHPPQIRLSA